MNEFEKLYFVLGFSVTLLMVFIIFIYQSLKAKTKDLEAASLRPTGNWEEKYREECYKTRDLTNTIARHRAITEAINADYKTELAAKECEIDSLKMDVQQLVNCLSDGKRRIRIIPRPVHRLRREKFNPDHYDFNDKIVFRPGHEG